MKASAEDNLEKDGMEVPHAERGGAECRMCVSSGDQIKA